MYYYLTSALKRKVLRELKVCFRHFFPQHRDILEYIQPKYAFKQRPQKGIVVTNVSSSPMKLSADNFVGTIISHAMLAKVDHHKGISIEWVKEDLRAIDANKGVFPSEPGIYYVEVLSRDSIQALLPPAEFEQLLLDEGKQEYYFYVDPLLKSHHEPILFVEDEDNIPSPQYVLHVPSSGVLPGSFRLFANQQPLITGHRFRFEAETSLVIGEDGAKLGMPTGQIKAVATSSEVENFDIVATVNDALEFDINGSPFTMTLDAGTWTAAEIAGQIRNALYASQVVPSTEFEISVTEDKRVVITASESLAFTTSNPELGFVSGPVPIEIMGNIYQTYFEDPFTLDLTVDGPEVSVDLFKGKLPPEDIATRIETEIGISGFEVQSEPFGDYVFDPQLGEITFNRTFEEGTRITASYKYPIDSRGPFGIKKDHSNNSAIPGVTLAFGSRMSDGDKSAVVISESRVSTALEYGGRWEVGVDLDIITRDPTTRDELSDIVQMYFFSIRKEYLTEEGLELLDISFGGDSEEIYDDTAGDYYFNSSISLNFQTDWAIHVPKPLTIERITPTSFGEEANFVGTDASPSPDQVGPVGLDELTLKRLGQVYLKGRSSNFERIK